MIHLVEPRALTSVEQVRDLDEQPVNPVRGGRVVALISIGKSNTATSSP
jgi:hypothetical protein